MKENISNSIINFVKKYYPDTAFYAVVSFNSEYNDCGYDNSVQSLMVFDVHKEEILPLKACTKNILELLDTIPCGYESNEPREDLTVII